MKYRRDIKRIVYKRILSKTISKIFLPKKSISEKKFAGEDKEIVINRKSKYIVEIYLSDLGVYLYSPSVRVV